MSILERLQDGPAIYTDLFDKARLLEISDGIGHAIKLTKPEVLQLAEELRQIGEGMAE